MDHRPFEEWLLNDERLNPEQERELRSHLRNCLDCTSLARANLSLRSAPVVAPPSGFALRFQTRLEAQRKIQRRRTVIGLSLLAATGMGGLLWLLFPFLPFLTLPPTQLASLWIDSLIYLAVVARMCGTVGGTLLDVLVSMVPGYVWPGTLALLAGMGFLWSVFFRRVGKVFVQSAA